MQINTLSDDYSVSPQIEVSDVPSIMQAGFKSVICNRPDQENPEPRQIEAIKAAVEAARMEFAENVFDPSSFGPDKIERQAELLAQLPSPVFAYCASGNRCSIVWAFAQAGRIATDTILDATTQAGYQLAHLRPQLEMLALNRAED
ncbi:Beta-lactamase hydrolase-like protein [Rhodobacteraceae bacterium IMCC1933]|nr:Beta-lactamase hydrolase-like protein [Rhodobacteraceae bacterium IMCC1923]MDP4068967.1 Beta-lactamase hydrolase-like protein [Rhodobacteraceae bacterium IMCC1933]MDP4072749.1 Beta-lactamase hydrolase-like protein [Rhodobacteraceae bacterium IMCC1909]